MRLSGPVLAVALLSYGPALALECQPFVASEYAHMQEQSKLTQSAGARAKAVREAAQAQHRSLTPAEREQAIRDIRQACSSAGLSYTSMRMLKWALETPDCTGHPERGDAAKLAEPIKQMREAIDTICSPQDWLR